MCNASNWEQYLPVNCFVLVLHNRWNLSCPYQIQITFQVLSWFRDEFFLSLAANLCYFHWIWLQRIYSSLRIILIWLTWEVAWWCGIHWSSLDIFLNLWIFLWFKVGFVLNCIKIFFNFRLFTIDKTWLSHTEENFEENFPIKTGQIIIDTCRFILTDRIFSLLLFQKTPFWIHTA